MVIAIILIRCIARGNTLTDAQEKLASIGYAGQLRDAFLRGGAWRIGGLFRSTPILGSDGLLENIDGTPYMG